MTTEFTEAGTVLSVPYAFIHSVLTTKPMNRYYYFHFTDEETEAHGD